MSELRTPTSVLLGAGSAILGLLPWLITGLRLPLQNLWATDTVVMPVALLPFSQYYLFLIIALIVVGSTIAGVLGRLHRPRLIWLIGGVLVVQLIALGQTAITVRDGLSDRSASIFYLVALIGVTVAAMLLGTAVLVIIARAPQAGVVIGTTISAIAFGIWLSALARPIGMVVTPEPIMELLRFFGVLPAIIVGVAIAWAGIATSGRKVAAIASLLLLWIGSTLITAVSAAAGSRVLAGDPAEMLAFGSSVFRDALFIEGGGLRLLILAAAVAFVGLITRSVLARRRTRRAA